MGERQPLDVFQVPLAGTHLIEASAGTGKTHTIAALYLRLILEAGRPVDRILVVTFTKAATAALKARIRGRLVAAREALLAGEGEDTFFKSLLSRCPERVEAQMRLNDAIGSFDEAAIFTIHGWCQRILADAAFESAMPFETEIVPDETDLLREITQDFWRHELYDAGALFLSYALAHVDAPDGLLAGVAPYIGKPFLKRVGGERAPDPTAAELAYETALTATRELWGASRSEVREILISSRALNRRRYKLSKIPSWILQMDALLHGEGAGIEVFEGFEKFTSASLAAATTKGQTTPRHAFFESCGRLREAVERLRMLYDTRLQVLRRRLLDYANGELGARRRRLRQQSYDDLLINVHARLCGERGMALAHWVRTRYNAALIDEFQDTDPLQYEIFARIYAGTDLPCFAVGDPKQAIYSFRGADIFAYLRGRRAAAQTHTLTVNWRSDPPLIRAVNTLFSRSQRPFLFDEIAFDLVTAAPKERETLGIADETPAPFVIWFLSRGEGGKPISKGVARERAARATAAEVARLLALSSQGQATLGNWPLRGGDIAVLVRKHEEGQRVQKALRTLEIASVQQGTHSVFESWEALELERVLLAVAEPGRQARIEAALATEMLGWSADRIHALGADEAGWEACLERFHAYHRLWSDFGFMRMFRQLLEQERVAERLLGYGDGERRLTNVLHLSELIGAQAARHRAGVDRVLKWLAQQRTSPPTSDDETLLRLESDEHLVQIVTIHKSKGLEYPIVFCPYLWDGRIRQEGQGGVLYHDPADDYRSVLDLGSDYSGEASELARREVFAENLRLLYVALTRARHRCYLLWGAIKDYASAAPAWLLHPPPSLGTVDPLDDLRRHVAALGDAAMRDDLDRLAQQSDGAIQVLDLPSGDAAPSERAEFEARKLSARVLTVEIPCGWRITSFSALAVHAAAELPDHDALTQTGAPRSIGGAPGDIFSFPRGARAGRCLHAIFEHLDFNRYRRQDLESLVRRSLAEHGIAADWTPGIADHIERVLATPLDAQVTLCLSDITSDRRLNELEFYYPIAGFQSEVLSRLLPGLNTPLPPGLTESQEQGSFAATEGYMKGYIDMVFEAHGRYYVLDYKSNWLGATHEAYHRSLLPGVVATEGYGLQYLVYTLAVHRYLQRRLVDYDYEAHFGGVFYLFLRGMDPRLGPDYGIFRDRPAWRLVEAIDQYLQTGRVAA